MIKKVKISKKDTETWQDYIKNPTDITLLPGKRQTSGKNNEKPTKSNEKPRNTCEKHERT